MRRLFIVLVLVFAALDTWAACGGSYAKVGTVITTYDSTNECIQAAITDADYDDTVQVGDNENRTWTKQAQGCKTHLGADINTFLCIKKAIKLYGGTGAIKFTDASLVVGVMYQPDANSVGKTFELKGFSFDAEGKTYSSGLLAIIPTVNTEFTDGIKIHDNTFTNIVQFGIWPYRLVYGVIYKNTFADVTYPIRPDGANLSWGTVAQTHGTSTNIFFEDNLITGSVAGREWGLSDPGGGAPGLVLRYNTWQSTGEANSQVNLDQHGLQSMTLASGYTCPGNECGLASCTPTQAGSCDNTVKSCGQYSTMKSEIYGNKFNITATSILISIRGGAQLAFYNKINPITGDTSVYFNNQFVEHGCDSCADVGSYVQHITKSYYWSLYADTVLKGMAKTLDKCGDAGSDAGSRYSITENTDYFNHNTSYDGETEKGIYCGTSLPAHCATGDGAWITTQGCASTDLTAIVGARGVGSENRSADISGNLYKCTSTDTWTPYYTPYIYPHPLRGTGKASVSIGSGSVMSIGSGATATLY